MKSFINYTALILLLTITSRCAVVGGIFKAGVAWGILLVVGIVALIIFLVSKAGKK